MRGRAPTRRSGFTLLEIIVAVTIFAFIAAVAEATIANCGYLTGAGKRARQLRVLAESKLGEILTFERHFDDVLDGDFGGDKSLGDEGAEWKWQLDVRDVTVFGISTQEDAQYLFGQPTDDEKAQAAAATTGQPTTGGAAPAKKGETQQLRELTLKVSAPSGDGTGDSVEIITFMPLVDRKTASTPPK